MFEYKTTIKMYDVDAAGRLFFANQLKLVHEAFETFLESRDFKLIDLLEKSPYLLPVIQTSTSFLQPLHLSDSIRILLELGTQGKTSITLVHKIFKEDNTLAGKGFIKHVCIQKKSGKAVPLPEELLILFK